MHKAKAILAVVVFVTGLLRVSTATASAQTFAGAHFTCEMDYPSIPSSFSAPCSGSVTGAGVSGGQAYACGVEPCDLRIEIDGNENCAAMGESPPLGFYTFDVYVNGEFISSGSASRWGAALTFGPSQELNGAAAWIPHGLIPTCENPGPLTVTIEGTFYGSS